MCVCVCVCVRACVCFKLVCIFTIISNLQLFSCLCTFCCYCILIQDKFLNYYFGMSEQFSFLAISIVNNLKFDSVGNNQTKQLLCDALAEWSVCVDVVQLCSRWLHGRCIRAHSRASQQQNILCWGGKLLCLLAPFINPILFLNLLIVYSC